MLQTKLATKFTSQLSKQITQQTTTYPPLLKINTRKTRTKSGFFVHVKKIKKNALSLLTGSKWVAIHSLPSRVEVDLKIQRSNPKIFMRIDIVNRFF